MRAADPDNNTKVGASSSSPPLHAEVRAALDKILNEFERTIIKQGSILGSQQGETEDAILQAVVDALLAGLPPKKSMDPAYKTGSDAGWGCTYGFNEALDAVTRVIGELCTAAQQQKGESNGK